MTTEPTTSALDENSAAAALASILEPEEPIKEEKEAEAPETPEEPEVSEERQDEPESEESDPVFTIKVDGKEIEVPLSELKNGYQRQADYTRKTMEVAEARKTAEAETQRMQQERAIYAQRLNEATVVLANQLQDADQINWQQLIDTDPIEYLKQRNLYEQRQAAFQKVQFEQQQLHSQQQADQALQYQNFLATQREELLAKLPEWKDEGKGNAEKADLKAFLNAEGFNQDEINGLADHRYVIVARKAMLYDKMMEKAKAAAKKVEKLPTKVERPGVADSKTIDKRSSAWQRLSKTGRAEDAATLLADFV
jgi:hypothetical protein